MTEENPDDAIALADAPSGDPDSDRSGKDASAQPTQTAVGTSSNRTRRAIRIAAVLCLALVVVLAVSSQKSKPHDRTLPRQIQGGVDKGILSRDPVIAVSSTQRELLVAPKTLRRPFFVTIPPNHEARLMHEETRSTEFALLVAAPEADGFVPTYVVQITTFPAIDIAETADRVMDAKAHDELLKGYRPLGESVLTSVGYHPAVQRDFAFTTGTGPGRGRLVVTMIGDQPVLLHYNATETAFAAHEGDFAALLASVRIQSP